MALFKFLKPKPIELHALEQDETWYQRAYWLTMLAKELKEAVMKLRSHNDQLTRQVNAGEPLTKDQQELLDLRDQVNALYGAKLKLEKRLHKAHQVNQGLIDEIHDLRHGIDRAA